MNNFRNFITKYVGDTMYMYIPSFSFASQGSCYDTYEQSAFGSVGTCNKWEHVHVHVDIEGDYNSHVTNITLHLGL